jgi:hypothetical protein
MRTNHTSRILRGRFSDRWSWALLLGLLLAPAGCTRDEFGEPVPVSVEEQAYRSEFEIAPARISLGEYRRLKGVKGEECFTAYRHPTHLQLCIYAFPDPAKAREAAAQAAAWRPPFGRFRAHVVGDSRLFAIDGQLKDQPIVNRLKAELMRAHGIEAP